ncbi:MAG TPA: hypothetical protein VIX63_00200 [Vicinamibacterales bacterium]
MIGPLLLALVVTAPPSLAPVAERLRTIDQEQLETVLADAGLALPALVRVTLIDEDDTRARQTPRWIVGFAVGTEDVAIFPARVGSYPYASLESVLRHEVVHLALSSRAGGHGLPRWFQEGVAVSVEEGWTWGSDLRLLLGAAGAPGIADLGRLFQSETHLGSAEAYRLAAALVADVRERHGAAVPGAIAGRVARGVPFPHAFRIETGETPDEAAARAWAGYRRWTAWLPVVTGGSAVWTLILALAFVAFVARSRKRARRRKQWADEEELPLE